jgi:hypothetical protein
MRGPHNSHIRLEQNNIFVCMRNSVKFLQNSLLLRKYRHVPQRCSGKLSWYGTFFILKFQRIKDFHGNVGIIYILNFNSRYVTNFEGWVGFAFYERRQQSLNSAKMWQATSLFIIYLSRVLCLSVCVWVCVCVCVCVTICVGTLSYSFSFSNQTD